MLRRIALPVVAWTIFSALPAIAQATFDAQSQSQAGLTSAANTLTFTHATASATNRLLLVSVHLNVRPATGTTVTNVTYGGQPLTLLDAISDGGPDTRTELWYLLAPPTGANNVVVTAGGITPGQTVDTVAGATTLNDADQSAPLTAANSGTNDPATVTVTGTTTNDLLLSFVSARETVTLTPDAPQVAGYNVSTGGTNDDVQAASGGRAGAAGNTLLSWNVSANRRWSILGVRVRQATADVEVTQRALNDPVIPGGVLTYTFDILNNGPSTATGVTLTDPLPGTVTFVNSSTTQGSCSGTTTVTCNIGTLLSGQTATVTIQATAPVSGGFVGNNTGAVTTTTIDPATPNAASANAYSLAQATVCGTQPGKDGAGGTLAGIVNSYWPGTAGAAVGATTITLGARRGAAVGITAGDLILVMQMQDAAIDSNNDDRYGNGNGVPGGTTGTGAGVTNLNNAGRYEYVVATNAVGAAGGSLTFTGVGGTGGLLYAYTNANATATQGQRRFQVIRVPQYTTATLGATATAAAWNGTTGGLLAFDVVGDLALGGATVSVNGLGFRGGAGRALAGGAGSSNDYRAANANTTHAIKGEGIAGTPEWVLDSGANLDVGSQGYPNGDYARGAPGNAGGGGTDGNPAANDQNSGGGGGANWGRGGTGGNTWLTAMARGGFGGGPFYGSPGRVVLGGGGGAGSRNNSSSIASAGGAGGGAVLIRAGRITGTGTITANGAAAYNTTANDGGGGGGAGGSIVILARGGGIGGLTLRADGGRGGDAWSTQAPAGYPGERHGPGGGGGGGYIAVNGTPASTSVSGGAPGITTTANDTFGAQPGAPGNVVLTAAFEEISGIVAGCVDLSVTISDSPDPVIAGNNLTYTLAVTNNSTIVPAQNATLILSTPPGTTFASIAPPPGWTCTTPAIGGTGTVSCSRSAPLAPSTGSGNFTLIVTTSPTLADGSTISESAITSTSNPEPNTANNTASTTTNVIRRVDVAVTKITNDPGPDGAFAQGETLTYTIHVTNNGPSRATNIVMTDPLPTGFAFGSVTPAGPVCTQSAGTVTCTYATLDPSAANVITISGTIVVNTTQLVNTASSTRTETDTNAANDSATASASVLAPTVVHMLSMHAEQDRDGKVQISWTTSFEAENLGFNLYRETTSGRERVNKQVIAGSAFFAHQSELRSGRAYRWRDKIPLGEFAQYWLEDIDLHGTRTMHGPIAPLAAREDDLGDDVNTDTLADLGSVGGIFVSPRGLGAPIRPNTSRTKKQLAQQWELAAQPAVKLMVTEEGWYHVSKGELAAAGLDVSRDRLALFAEGVEQPLGVNADAVEFYGIGIDTPAAGARAYWLISDKGKGKRVRADKTGHAKRTASRTDFTFERIERTVFFAALTNNGDGENFFGDLVTSEGAVQEIEVRGLDRSGSTAMLELTLQGGTDQLHVVDLAFNGRSVRTVRVADRKRLVTRIAIPLAWIVEGTNNLTLQATGGDADVSVVESVRFTYPRVLVADDDALKVLIAGGTGATVSGFTSPVVRAIDVTDPSDPVDLAVTLANGGASFVAPSSGMRTIVVMGSARIQPPAQIVPSRASSWNDPENAADMVVISARALVPAAASLQARRNREGVSTVVVDIQDLYDEFNFGERGSEAIRDFLLQSREWKRSPKYVLFLGDSSIDPRNYLGLGTFDLVPTRLVPTAYMKTASDDWFADFGASGVPQLAVGRIPARTLAEAETMIGRIVARDTTGNTRVAFVADQEFIPGAQSLAALFPSAFQTTFASAPDAASFESLMLTYVGHGSVGLWNSGSFTADAASQLTNGSKAPIVAAMTCLNGYYHDLFAPSMAEGLLRSTNGGAVAVWASSTLTEPAPQLEIARAMFRALLAGATLGEATARAKSATQDMDVRRSWILFGDPSMKFR